jgi:hypothetical protein
VCYVLTGLPIAVDKFELTFANNFEVSNVGRCTRTVVSSKVDGVGIDATFWALKSRIINFSKTICLRKKVLTLYTSELFVQQTTLSYIYG